MSVMACDRTDRTEIMCDDLITVAGREQYICRKCQDDLELARAAWPARMTVAELHQRLEEFMASSATLPGQARLLDGPEAVEAEIEKLIRRPAPEW